MKNILLDICLVLLILLIGTNILTPSNLSQQQFSNEMSAFSQDVSSGVIEERYHVSKDPYPNKVSQIVEEVSDVSRDSIRVIVESFSKALFGF